MLKYKMIDKKMYNKNWFYDTHSRGYTHGRDTQLISDNAEVKYVKVKLRGLYKC